MVILQMSPEDLSKQIKEAVSQAMSTQPMLSPDKLLTREEASMYLNVSLPTLNTWEKNNQIRPIRYGNRVYFRESDLLNKQK